MTRYRLYAGCLTISFLLATWDLPAQSEQQSADSWEAFLGVDAYVRVPARDGYVIGNGRMYAIGGLGRELMRNGKTQLSDRPVSRTRLSWVVGPFYTVGNLGYGWELTGRVGEEPISWAEETMQAPSGAEPFWQVHCRTAGLEAVVTDLIVPGEAVLLRRIVVRRPEEAGPATVRLHFPVYADPRNGVYAMFNGREVDAGQIERWGRYCGPYLKPRPSVPSERMRQVRTDEKAIVLLGASRALWQEISTIVPPDTVYARMFPARALATTVAVAESNARTGVDQEGLWVDLGVLRPGESRTLAVWLVAVTGKEANLETKALEVLNNWRGRRPDQVVKESKQQLPLPLLTRTDGVESPLLRSLTATAGVAEACQARAGGVMAQPYMYPMYYVRDQYGSFRLFMALGDYERALRVLRFYVAMEGRDGIQNAHDAFPEPPDPTQWLPGANLQDGYHRRAEVPSYIILMARDYYRATGDLNALRPLYPRLAYNLRVQEFSPNGVLPWATDESYTNTGITRPRYEEEMSDSQLLFLGAVSFMTELADKMGNEADAAEFRRRYQLAKEALFRRLWLPEQGYFAFAREASMNADSIDRRPAFDALLRWFWLELGDPQDSVAQGCRQTVLDSLMQPLRVVPHYDWCAGMDPGYLLYALSRSQHPAAHAAAQLLLRYASEDGLYSEYYEYENSIIRPSGGTMRPWESSINGAAIVQYLLGFRPDLPNRRLFLQPHLPPDWPGWQSRELSLGEQGSLTIALKRSGKEIICHLVRRGGTEPQDVSMEFGLFGPNLRSRTAGLSPVPGRADLLQGELHLPAGARVERRVIFRVAD